jgi:hypothetical protein
MTQIKQKRLLTKNVLISPTYLAIFEHLRTAGEDQAG